MGIKLCLPHLLQDKKKMIPFKSLWNLKIFTTAVHVIASEARSVPTDSLLLLTSMMNFDTICYNQKPTHFKISSKQFNTPEISIVFIIDYLGIQTPK